MSRPTAARAALLVACVALAAHVNVARNDLVWDSDRLAVHNPHLESWPALASLLWPTHWEALRPSLRESYRPAALLTFFVERRVWRGRAWGYHLTNACLHALNSALVLWLALQMGWRGRGACVAGLVFALHPAGTEAVAWVNNRSVLLATGFGVLSMGLFLRSLDPAGSIRHGAAGVAALVAGLLANESIVLLPALAVVWVAMQPRPRRRWAGCACLCAASAVYLAVRAAVTSIGPPPDPSAAGPMAEPHWLLVLRTLKTYAAMLAFPANLSADRRLPTDGAGAAVAVAAALGAAVWLGYSFRRRRASLYPLVLALLMLAPVSNVVHLAGRPVADQRAYPVVPAAALLAGLLVAGRRRVVLVLAAAAALTALTVSRNAVWRSELSLWRDTATATPTKARAFLNLGLAQERGGRPARALPHYRRAVRLFPGYALARLKWASLVADTGRPREALAIYQVLPTASWGPEYWAVVGASYMAMGRETEGWLAWTTALDMAPFLTDLRAKMARAKLSKGQPAPARRLVVEGLRFAPNDAQLLDALAEIHLAAGEPRKAAALYARAARTDRKLLSAHLGLARALVQLQDYGKAAWVLNMALRSAPYSAPAYRMLAQVSGALGAPQDQQQFRIAAQRIEESR